MMIKHIVFFSAKDPKDREALYEGLTLLRKIPDCLHLEIGRNLQSDAISPGGPDFVVYGEFKDEKQLASYKAHRTYEEAISIVRPLREMRIAADFLSDMAQAADDASSIDLNQTCRGVLPGKC